MTCKAPVEVPYYGQILGNWNIDICAHCGSPGADPKVELKKTYKTVLPLCIT